MSPPDFSLIIQKGLINPRNRRAGTDVQPTSSSIACSWVDGDGPPARTPCVERKVPNRSKLRSVESSWFDKRSRKRRTSRALSPRINEPKVVHTQRSCPWSAGINKYKGNKTSTTAPRPRKASVRQSCPWTRKFRACLRISRLLERWTALRASWTTLRWPRMGWRTISFIRPLRTRTTSRMAAWTPAKKRAWRITATRVCPFDSFTRSSWGVSSTCSWRKRCSR